MSQGGFDFEKGDAYAYGAEAEHFIATVLGPAMCAGESGCEVKRKQRPDSYFYFETEQDSFYSGWKQSATGAYTPAGFLAFVLGATRITVAFPTDVVRMAIQAEVGQPKTQPKKHRTGNPTRGRLIRLEELARFAATR